MITIEQLSVATRKQCNCHPIPPPSPFPQLITGQCMCSSIYYGKYDDKNKHKFNSVTWLWLVLFTDLKLVNFDQYGLVVSGSCSRSDYRVRILRQSLRATWETGSDRELSWVSAFYAMQVQVLIGHFWLLAHSDWALIFSAKLLRSYRLQISSIGI